MKRIIRTFKDGMLQSETIEEYTAKEFMATLDYEPENEEKELNISNLEFFSYNPDGN